MSAVDALSLIRDHQAEIDQVAPGLAARLSESFAFLSAQNDELQQVVTMFSHGSALVTSAIERAHMLETRQAAAAMAANQHQSPS